MSILDDIKDVYDLSKKIDNVDLQEKILHLREEIIEMRELSLRQQHDLYFW